MKKNSKHLLAILGIIMPLFTISCLDKDDRDEPIIEPPLNGTKMVVVNQGQFSKANASLSTINYHGEVNNDVFQAANSRPLGDVAQAVARIGGNLYITLNNSNKVEVVHAITFKSEGTILFDQPINPRYITQQDDTSAIVSGMTDKLVRINTKTFKTIEYIPVAQGSMEQMLTIGKKIFCTMPYGKNAGLYVYAANDMKTPKKIETPAFPLETSSFVKDKDENIWTLCKTDKNVLICINPATEKVTDSIAIPDSITVSSFARLGINFTGTKLFFNGNNKAAGKAEYIFSADIADKTIKNHIELSGLGMTYGMAVGPEDDIYICDGLDYSAQRGYIRQYRTDGSYTSYRVGIYPGQVFFY